MEISRRRPELFVLALVAIFCASMAIAQDFGEAVVKSGVVAEDLYAAGGRVHILADVDGDVVAAGGRVIVERQVTGDVILAGGSIDIRGPVLDDIRAAGGSIHLDSEVGGDAVAAAGNVTLTSQARVDGRAFIAGGNIEVGGHVARQLRAAGGSVSISGEIEGDVEVTAGDVWILPTARIQGALIYRSPKEATIDPAAEIAGDITYIAVKLPEGPTAVERATMAAIFLLALFVAGVVLFLLFPNVTRAAARTVSGDPWKSLGLGLALLVTTPLAALLLMLTVLGIPLGLTALAMYFVSILVGFLIAVFFLGEVGLRLVRRPGDTTNSAHLVSLLGAFILLWILQLIPVAGAVILFLSLVFGLGAWSLTLHRAYSSLQSGPTPHVPQIGGPL